MTRTKSDKIGNGKKCEASVWVRAITANSEWPDKVNITFFLIYLFILIRSIHRKFPVF